MTYLRARYYDSSFRRFITEDPIKDGVNWYAYCGNNPVAFIDPSGLVPTEKEAAEMAKHIYSYDKNSDINERRVAGWRLIDTWYGRESMEMGIYIRDNDDWRNPSEYAVVFKGTKLTNLTAWKNDIQQGTGGKSADTWDAISYASGFVEANPSKEITFVGHSKGGQEARSAALQTNKNAIVFNPAAVNMSDYGLKADNYTATMRTFIVDGDFLDTLNNQFVKANKNLKIIPAGRRINLPRSSNNPIQCHTMDAVITGLKAEGY